MQRKHRQRPSSSPGLPMNRRFSTKITQVMVTETIPPKKPYIEATENTVDTEHISMNSSLNAVEKQKIKIEAVEAKPHTRVKSAPPATTRMRRSLPPTAGGNLYSPRRLGKVRTAYRTQTPIPQSNARSHYRSQASDLQSRNSRQQIFYHVNWMKGDTDVAINGREILSTTPM